MPAPVAVLALSALAAIAEVSSPAAPRADLVLLNARVWTGESARPWAQAIAVAGDRLLAVGGEDEIASFVSPATRVVDAGGRLVVPGLIDNHTHFVAGGFALLGTDLRMAPSREEFVRLLGEHVAKVPKDRWVTAAQWDHERWPGAPLPHRDWIDAATRHHFVFIDRLDGHMGLANSRALAAAGITRATPDPPGGTIVRDGRGEPTGVLKDAAMSLVYAVIPAATAAELADAVAAASRHAASLGVTTVQDMTLWHEWPALLAAREQGALDVRVYARTPIASWERQRDWIRAHGRGDHWLRLGGFKGYVDGSLGSSTALFFEPYADAPETAGIFVDDWFPEGILEQRVAGADRESLQVSVHAIGERANAEILELFGRVGAANGPRDRRFRVEHAQHLRGEEIAEFARRGVVASMQPSHCADDGRWADKRLGARSRDSYVFRSLLDAGAVVTFGSDWPVAPLDPILGIAAAVTRQTLDGKNPGGWHPEEKISVEEALVAYTSANAWAEFAESDKGSLAPGKLADFVVLSADLFAVPPAEIETTKALLTVAGGRIVHDRLTSH